MENKNLTRRDFIKQGTAAVAGLTIASPSILGKSHGYTAPSDKMNIAAIGVGGIGFSNMSSMETENIVALCDVDFNYAKKAVERHPDAARYSDFRKMFDEMGNNIDGVLVATPDHTHAVISATALELNKHLYCQKPMTHSVYETRLLTRMAAVRNVVTQMGNQGASTHDTDTVVEWIQNGEIGEVYRVDCATDRPLWPQGLETPTERQKVPKGLDWDMFIGPAKMRPYNRAYHPWDWRGWWDFGTGALGDMACHIMQVVFEALKLQYPILVEGSSTKVFPDCAPNAEHVKFIFPARQNLPKLSMPEVEVHWYDGGMMPEFPKGWPAGTQLMREIGGLTIFHGTKDTLVCGALGFNPFLLSGRTPSVPKTRRRVKEFEPANEKRDATLAAVNHVQDWIRACKESPASRINTKSNFDLAGPLNETVVMAVLAVRLKELMRPLLWDGENMRFTNVSNTEMINLSRTEMVVVNGDPKMTKIDAEVNAVQYISELIKHTYREGWSLPAMPKI